VRYGRAFRIVIATVTVWLATSCGHAPRSPDGIQAGGGGSQPTLTASAGSDQPPPLPYDADSLPGCAANVPTSGQSVSWLPAPIPAPDVTAEVHPARVFICPDERVAIVRYSANSAFGAFWLREYPPPSVDFGEADIRELATICTGCTDNRMVQLLPSVDAALMAGSPGPTSVSWFQNGAYFSVIGPGETFTPARAEAAAKAAAAMELNLSPQ